MPNPIRTAGIEAASEVERLVDEQAALRRVATLVAGQASQGEIVAAVAAEVGRMLGVEDIRLVRFEAGSDGGDCAVVMASWGVLADRLPLGERHRLGGENAATRLFASGSAVRIDDYSKTSGAIAERVKEIGVTSTVAVPITVDGQLWGGILVSSLGDGPLPADTEARLGQFTELMGTAIANTEARLEVARLAQEQAALRRVATLVAEAAEPARLFAKVAEEIAMLFGEDIDSGIVRYEDEKTATVMAAHGQQNQVGVAVKTRLRIDGSSVAARVLRERRPVRLDDYPSAEGLIAGRIQQLGTQSALGCPIFVQGRLWGAMIVSQRQGTFPPDTELRLSQFTELVATAIANVEARTQLERLATEQAAFRRVATLVAKGAAPGAVFDAVIGEVGELLGAWQVGLLRAEGENEATVLAQRGLPGGVVHGGMRLKLDGDSATGRVLRTGRSARVGWEEDRGGTIARIARETGTNVSIAAPVTVEGALWGMISVSWKGEDEPPEDAEERLAEFAELLDTAIGNADSRDQLTASRARVLSAGDEARRRVVRDLHDGAQQRLVQAIVNLKLAQRAIGEDRERAAALLAEGLRQTERGNAELRELAHGILPSVLTRGGLRAAIDSLVSRLDIVVDLDVADTRASAEVEASAYFLVAEALTNVVKHARAERAAVVVAAEECRLRIEVRDDGVGGADPQSHGLVGIADRVAALGGELRIESPPGGGTLLVAELPLSS